MLIRHTLLYLPAQILAPLVQFASILIWAYLLSPQALGVVTLLVAMQEVFYAMFFGWWGLYTLRFIAGLEPQGERPAYLRTETVAMLASTLAQTLVALVAVHLAFGSVMTPGLLAAALLFMATRSLNSYAADRARAEARIRLYTLVQTAGPVIGFGFGLLWMWRFGPSVDAVLYGFILAQTLGVAATFLMSDFCRGLGRPSLAVLREAARFGGVQTSSQLLAIVAINAPRFIVGQQLGLAAAGMFSVGYSLGIRASSFAVSLVTAGSYPLVVRKMQTEGKKAAFLQLGENMTLVAFVVVPVALGLLAINRPLVDLLVAPDYRAVTYSVLPLATLGGLFRYLRAHTSDQVFLLSLRPQFGTIIALCDLAVAILSILLGIWLWQISGAAIGPLASGIATFALSFALSRFRFGFHAPFGAFTRIFLAALAMFGLVRLLLWALPPGLGALAGAVVAGGLAYAGAVLLLMPKERRMFFTLLGKVTRRNKDKAGG